MLCNFFENQNEVAFYGEKNARSIVILHFPTIRFSVLSNFYEGKVKIVFRHFLMKLYLTSTILRFQLRPRETINFAYFMDALFQHFLFQLFRIVSFFFLSFQNSQTFKLLTFACAYSLKSFKLFLTTATFFILF